MNYQQIKIWLTEHNIVLEQSFVESLRAYARTHKKSGQSLTKTYAALGCTKTDLSRWDHNPCSTHATCSNAKLSVCRKASELFGLTPDECEKLANKAGLSLCQSPNILAKILQQHNASRPKLPAGSLVSERMFQYYIAGRKPTKQALLAIAISLGLDLPQINNLLNAYGYCLSKSLPNDVVVLWHLENSRQHPFFLFSINEELANMELPLLMTKSIRR